MKKLRMARGRAERNHRAYIEEKKLAELFRGGELMGRAGSHKMASGAASYSVFWHVVILLNKRVFMCLQVFTVFK
jgi:hypothetical protein